MPGYKYPNIDSGATPIASAGCAPDRLTILRKNSIVSGATPIENTGRAPDKLKFLRKNSIRRRRGRKFEPMIDYKYPIIVSGATLIENAGRAPDKELLREDNE
jgi:hypothetical protein